MKLPHQAPPVQRRVQQNGRSSQHLSAAAEAAINASEPTGIGPAALEDCYRLPGLAQQLCILAY